MQERHFFTDAQESPDGDSGNGESRYRFTDTASATLAYAGEDDLAEDVFEDDFDPSNAETVTLDSPWNEFFETDEYIEFDATVAQPIVQPYLYNGSLHKFKKDEDELKRAQAQIDNLPWTMGHPPQDRVTSAEQIRGFWKDPRWNDGQQSTLYIPATDQDAVRFAVTNDEVSIGFSGRLDWQETDDIAHDAVQRDMAYDHIASVESGRCPPEAGCGLHTDESAANDADQLHGHVVDAVQTQETEDIDIPNSGKWSEGDWVKFTDDGETRHGKVADADDERALVYPYDYEEEELSDETVGVSTDNLRSWVGPYVDSCPGDTCSCGCHVDDDFTDVPDGIYVEDGDWYGIAPSENPDGEPKYELNDCNDVKDAYNFVDSLREIDSESTSVSEVDELRNNGDYGIETSTLVSRIQDAASAHDCTADTKPWVDTDTTNDSNTMTNLEELFSDNDITKEQVLDHYEIDRKESPTDFYDGEPTVDDLADDFDAVSLLADEKEDLEQQVDELEEQVREAQRPVFADKAEELAELTEKWGDKDDLMERFDAEDEDERLTVDDLEDKIELVEDIKGTETTTVNDESHTDETDDGVPEGFEQTKQGRFDLRERTKLE